MMRKALVLACVMIFALGSMASAAYIINGSAANSEGSGYMADAVFGDWPVTARASHSATVNTAAQLSILDDAAPGQLLFRDLVAGAPDTWTLLLHTGLDFSDEFATVKLWSAAGPSWDAYANPLACLTVVADPMGYYQAGEILWQGAFAGDSTRDIPTAELLIHANKTTNPLNEGLVLSLGACEVIPEPGSIVAMFAGLVGLVGLRRRK